MGRAVANEPALFDGSLRHQIVLAHQDDEVGFAGLLQRLPPDTPIVWLTNGDGLAPRYRTEPTVYAETRRRESIAAVAEVGVSEPRLTFLGHSELAIYRHLASLVNEGPLPATLAFFEVLLEEVLAAVRAREPQVLWTLAWQGGHTGHDLVHLLATCAARVVGREIGRTIRLFEVPEYELASLVALRFRPWRRAPHHELLLTPAEYDRKRALLGSYPSQVDIIGGFQALIRLYGVLGALRLRRVTLASFLSREVFAEVPPERDLTRSTHVSSRLDYLFDRWFDTPMRFDRTLAVLARHLLGARGG